MFDSKFYISLLLLVITSTSNAQWPGQVPPSEVPVYLPSNYDPKTPSPLVIFLHGYAPLTTAWYDILLPLQKDANNYGYIFAKPDGSQDGLGEFYWNATDACCDMWGNEPDHVGYLLALVDSIKENYNIDPSRVHLIGHSNGGFMAHRMACESTETFASIVSIAGATWNDPSNCNPTKPIHVLQIHGTLDPVIWWLGGYIGLTPYPGVNTTIEYWASHNGCSIEAADGGNFNFDWLIFFNETTRWLYEGCDNSDSGSAELWQITAGGHFPSISDEGIEALFNYLDTHTRHDLCEADLNSDEIVDVQDILITIAAWGETKSIADLNSDGIVNIADLLLVINRWGPC